MEQANIIIRTADN